MPEIAENVRRLSQAAWALRRAAPRRQGRLPAFALALFTDDRRQRDLVSLLEQLPERFGEPSFAVIFRHDGLPDDERLSLARRAMRMVQEKGHLFLMARGVLPGADGFHAARGPGLISRPVHDLAEGMTARLQGADVGFVSPVFPTISHPDAPALGPARAAVLARQIPLPAFALGGLTAENTMRLHGAPFYGIGVIGAWSG